MPVDDVHTPAGAARIVLDVPRRPRAVIALGHGAGGSVDAPDLLAVTGRLHAAGLAVARITQPYALAGRRAPAPAPQLDQAWIAACAAVRARRGLGRLPFFAGGRSSGARVACRTAGATRAQAVVALAFPLHPPGRPDVSRAGELLAAGVPVLVVQGERDSFGGPADLPAGPDVVPIDRADHSLRRDTDAVATAVLRWLAGQLPGLEA